MTGEQRQIVEDLFAELALLPAEEREAALARVHDTAVRSELASLLAFADGDSPGISTAIEAVAQAATAAGAFDDLTIGAGARFGHYRVVRRLGQGGMGEVFEAVRDDDFHKRVALKIVRYGHDSEYANRRFEQERQTLAGLEHPNIARLLDGGETPTGQPYLVLEYVEGAPIDRYCAGRSAEEILRLFKKVCDAVEYAHRNLIIHRDLKPANILVTPDGEPKLLDFGIAKLLDTPGDATQTAFAALTPQYASPEQLRGTAITTASDVYSLGLVLYELLSGRKPYLLSTASAVEMERIVCQTEPERPGVSGDLDNIVLLALRKDPLRRYRSVREFADDIDRFLTHRPVTARPDTPTYRARKFVRRHRTGVAAGFALLLAIAAGVAATVYQARVARQRFEQVRKLAHSFVFDYSDDLARLDGTTAVRERMVRTALEYLDNLSKNAGSDLGFQKELAAAYQKVGETQGFPTRPSLGHVDQAIASYRKAARIHEQIAARDPLYHLETGGFYLEFAGLLRVDGKYAEASRIAETARLDLVQRAQRQPSNESVQMDLAHSWCLLGDLDEDQFHSDASLVKFRQCEAIAHRLLASSRTFEKLALEQGALERLGTAATGVGQFAEALAAFDQDQRLLEEMVGLEPASPALHRSFALLAEFRASVYYDEGQPHLDDPRRCLVYARQYLDAARQMVEKDPNNTSARRSLATALYRESMPLKYIDPAAAVSSARTSVAMFDALIAQGRSGYLMLSRRGRAAHYLSEALLQAGRPEQARQAAAEALAGQRVAAAHDAEDPQEAMHLAQFLVTSAQIAEALRDMAGALGFLDEAERISSSVIARDGGSFGVLVPRSAVLEELARYWSMRGDEGQSQRRLAEARGLWRDFPSQNDYTRREYARLAAAVPARQR